MQGGGCGRPVHGAWFEYGTMSQFTGNTGTSTSTFNALSRKLRDATWTVGTTRGTGWLLRDQSGNYTTASNGFVWMNPLVPEVRNLVKGIMVDAITQFDLQIVQFDDHFAWPQAYGWDSYTAAVYKQETGNNLPALTTDATFAAWRRGKTQAFFAEISEAAKAAKPSVLVSLAPSPITTSSVSFNADWSQWMANADEVLPQVVPGRGRARAQQPQTCAEFADIRARGRDLGGPVGVECGDRGANWPGSGRTARRSGSRPRRGSSTAWEAR